MPGLPATTSWQLLLKTADVAWDEQIPAPHFCPNAEAEHGTLKVKLHLRGVQDEASTLRHAAVLQPLLQVQGHMAYQQPYASPRASLEQEQALPQQRRPLWRMVPRSLALTPSASAHPAPGLSSDACSAHALEHASLSPQWQPLSLLAGPKLSPVQACMLACCYRCCSELFEWAKPACTDPHEYRPHRCIK